MDFVALALFGLFLLALITLDVVMIISLVKPGDERKQMIVWRASSYTLLGTVGAMAIEVAVSVAQGRQMAINPFTQLGSTALLYCISLLLLKKKYGG